MTIQFSEEEKAEALSRCIDQMNEGKTPNLEELGDLGKEIAPLVETALLVRKTLGVIQPLPEEEMEKGFSRVRKKFEEYTFKRALKESLETGREKLSLERRTDFLILLTHFAKEVWGNTRLVKLLFLLRNEGEAVQAVGDFYSHYAYNFGAFDEDILKDVKALRKLGVIEKKSPPSYKEWDQVLVYKGTLEPVHVDGVYELTPRGEEVALELLQSAEKKHPGVIRDIQSIIEKYGQMSTDKLLAYTYKKYPDYAKNSKVKDQYSS